MSQLVKSIKKPFVTLGYDHADYIVDGTADDVQINAAILAINTAGGGELRIKEGTYNLAATVQHRSNVIVSGAGYATLINVPTSSIWLFDAMSNCTLRDIRFDGDTNTGRVICPKNSSDIHIERVWVTNAKTFGIFIEATGTATCQRIWIRDCNIKGKALADAVGGGPTSATCHCKDINILNNVISQDTSLSGAGSYKNALDIVAGDDLKIIGNTFNGNIVPGFEGDAKDNYMIIDNHVKPAFTTAEAPTGTGSIIIQENTSGGDKNFTIKGNVIDDGSIVIEGSSGLAITDWLIEGNIIKDTSTGTFQDCIYIYYANNGAIKGNILQGAPTGRAGIRLEQSDYVQMEGNHISNCPGAITDVTGNIHNSIVNNTFQNNTSNINSTFAGLVTDNIGLSNGDESRLPFITVSTTNGGDGIGDYVCDGTGDHTEINAAIAAASASGGGKVIIKEGTYVPSGGINLASNVILEGEGYGSYINLPSNVGLNISALSHVTIRNIRTSALNHTGSSYALIIQNSSDIHIENCIMLENNAYGILVFAQSTSTTEGVWVTGCYLKGRGSADVIGGGPGNLTSFVKDVWIHDNWVYQDASLGDLYATAIDMVRVDRVSFIGNKTWGKIFFGAEQSPNTYSILSHNIIQPANGSVLGDLTLQHIGISTDQNQNNIVSNNIIENGRIRIQGHSTARNLRTVVSDNVVINGPDSTFPDGIVLSYTDHATVEGNIIQYGTNGIAATSCTYISYIGNEISDVTNGYNGNSSSTNSIFVGNNFHSTVTNDIVNNDSTDSIIHTEAETGKVTIGRTTAGLGSRFNVYENTTNVNASAGHTIENDGTGDAVTQWLLTDTRRWVGGIDNSDSDVWGLSPVTDLANKVFRLDTSGAATFSGDVTVPDEAYGSGWNGSLEVPTKNAVYDKIEAEPAATATLTNKTIDGTNNAITSVDSVQAESWSDDSDTQATVASTGVIIKTGWGQIQGNGTTQITETVTFNAAFPNNIFSVQVTHGGGKGSVMANWGEGTVNPSNTSLASSADVTTGSFLVLLGRSAAYAAGSYYSYSWIAIGN